MDIRNGLGKDLSLTSELNSLLNELRIKRGFDEKDYLDKKIKKIENYFNQYKRDTFLVSLSGGVDSSVTLAILNKVVEKNPSFNIKAVTIPCFGKGTTNQEDTLLKVELLKSKFGVEVNKIDISGINNDLSHLVENNVGIESDEWAYGQISSYLRTPTLYYTTSLLTKEGYKPVLMGTTNKSEGEFLGYFGKASDGMVDLQTISDLYKGEVFKLGKYLGVPEEILSSNPNGDMFDNSTDEEVFGASYDFVELYSLINQYLTIGEFRIRLDNMSKESIEKYNSFRENIEKMRSYNNHKYLGHSPAIHLDVIETKNNNWRYFNYE